MHSTAEDGEYKLVDMERYACVASMGLNCLNWTGELLTKTPRGTRAFVDPRVLTGGRDRNHTILKLILRKPDGKLTHI